MDPELVELHRSSLCSDPQSKICVEGAWTDDGRHFVIADTKDRTRPRLVVVREVWLAFANTGSAYQLVDLLHGMKRSL